MKWLLAILAIGSATSAHAQWQLSFRKVTATLPGGAEFIEREATRDGETVRVQGVFFSAKQANFAVIDNAGKVSLAEAAAAAGALAGTNGGYFHPDFRPAGLEIADGTTVNGFEKAKLLSGVFVVTKGVPRIVRSGAYVPSSQDTHALQAGPFLVEKGVAIKGLNAGRAARRTVVAVDEKGRWALFIMSHATLAEAASVLATPEVFPDFPIVQALNLDGGSSTALWAATDGRPFYYREIGPVRNFLAVLPR